MILSKQTIQKKVYSGEIGVEPPPEPEQYQWASLDFRLGTEIYDLWTEEYTELTGDDQYVLKPGARVLADTMGTFRMPTDLAAQVAGRSTLGRKFVTVHQTAGWVDPGYVGSITLEIANFGYEAIRLNPGLRIGQLVFFPLDKDTKGYSGQYHGSRRPEPAGGL